MARIKPFDLTLCPITERISSDIDRCPVSDSFFRSQSRSDDDDGDNKSDDIDSYSNNSKNNEC